MTQRRHDTTKQVAEGLHLQAVRNHRWQIQACSAKEGQGLREGKRAADAFPVFVSRL